MKSIKRYSKVHVLPGHSVLVYSKASELIYECFLFFCRWYCHFDDDVYVNLPVLSKDLEGHDPIKESYYYGQSHGYNIKIRSPDDVYKVWQCGS